VKVEIAFLNDEEAGMAEAVVKQASFVIQMLDLSKMPHAIHLFLEQVNHNLWNDISFAMSSPSILLADPNSRVDSGDNNRISAFEDAGLAAMGFVEPLHNSSGVPNDAWSVCFVGKGPAFYIDKENRQSTNDDDSPCFGVVKDGKNVLREMYNANTSGSKLAKRVRILKATAN
jgi:hypothetical protein